MQEEGVTPDIITYNALISACAKRNQLEKAMEVFDALREHEGVVPDIITYNALISACAMASQPEKALEVFGLMREQGVMPDEMTYSALVSAGVKLEDPQEESEVPQTDAVRTLMAQDPEDELTNRMNMTTMCAAVLV